MTDVFSLDIGFQFPKSDLDSSTSATMEEDEISVVDSPGDIIDPSAYDKQRASLQTYLDSLPYEGETVEDMQDRLEGIVEKIYICAKSKNWLVLSTWDGMLQWYFTIILECFASQHWPLIIAGC